jgi:hypothetical protein
MSGIIDDLLGHLNYIDRIEGWIMSVRFGDYAQARKGGLAGVAAELLSSLFMGNTHTFALPRSGAHSLNEVEALLKKYGIAVFGRTHDARCMYFHVKRRQARWAEYLLVQAGVQLESATFDSRNAGYPGRHAPGWMPPAWSERPSGRGYRVRSEGHGSVAQRRGERSAPFDSVLEEVERRLL